jgi:DNA-binding NtrC family response regulator
MSNIESPTEKPLDPLASEPSRFGDLVGTSAPMKELFAILARVAASDVGMLIEGETGTGKELVAEAIHAASARKGKPFVVCDLAGVTRSLIESELFGHVRGAFTGADRERDGAFAQAAGGTIFIDEIAELEPSAQPRLLRALERRQVKPVGGSVYRDLDVRVIAATNRDLAEEVKAGRFREDLFHRLAVMKVRLPSLRERREDIPLLVDHLLQRAGGNAKLAPEALARLVEHGWPGNVRELKNVLDRSLSLLPPEGERVITPELLGLSDAAAPPAPVDEGFRAAKERVVTAWERAWLSRLLSDARGNVTRAARVGRLDRVHLYRLLRKHNIDVRGGQ